MRKAIFFLFLLSFLSLSAQEFSSVNYFYNLSYHSPAVKNLNRVQVDASVVSLYGRLPVGVTSNLLSVTGNFKRAFQVSTFLNQVNFGKNQSLLRVDGAASYHLKLNENSLTLGAGLRSFSLNYDETQLTLDFEEGSRTIIFGTDLFTESSFLVPVGGSFNSGKFKVGAYYGVGLGRLSTYGVYGRALTFSGKVKKAKVHNVTSVAFYRELVNPKISLENKVEVENFGLSVFFNQNFSSETESNNSSVGLGVFYLWKLFNLNYQLSTNRNGLGLNHQLGVQVYLPQ